MAMSKRARKRLVILIACAGLLVALTGGAYGARKAYQRFDAGRMHAAGLAAYNAGDYEGALRGLSRYVGVHQHDADALYKLADARRRVPQENQRHVHEAIRYARVSADSDPNRPEPLDLLLELYGQTGLVTERLEAADRALALNPKNPAAHEARVQCLSMLGKNAEALAAAGRWVDTAPRDPRAHNTMVQLMTVAGKPPAAIREYGDALLKRYPDDPAVVILHARICGYVNDTAAAIASARRAAAMPIESRERLLDLVRVLDLLSLSTDADNALAAATAKPDLAAAAGLIAAERAWKDGKMDVARERLAAAAPKLEEAPDDALGFSLLLDAPRPDAPGVAATRAELHRRTGNRAFFWAAVDDAYAKLLRNEPGAAKDRLREAISLDQNDSIALFLLGQAESGLGEWRQAVSIWDEAANRDPRWTAPRLSAATTLLGHGRVEDAHAEALRAVAGRAGINEVYLLAQTYTAMFEAGKISPGEPERAVGVIEEIRRQVPALADASTLLARVQAATGKIEEARASVKAVLENERTPGADSLLALAQAWKKHDPAQAGELVDLARKKHGDQPAVLFASALRSAEAGRADEGKAMIRAAIPAGDPEAKFRYEQLLATYLDRINDPEADPLRARLAAEHPDSLDAQSGLLELASTWATPDVAAEAIARVKTIAGEDSTVWKTYEARRLLTFEPTEKTAAQALTLLTAVLRADPHDPGVLALAAQAETVSNRDASAAEYLAKALDAAPQKATLYPQVIARLQQTGKTADAERRLRSFMSEGGLTPDLKRKRAQLLFNQGMWPEAMAEFEALAAAGDPQDRLGLALFSSRRGQSERAASIYDALLAESEPSTAAVLSAAEFFATQGDTDRGLRALDHLPAPTPRAQRDLIRGSFLERHGRAAEAESFYTAAAGAENNAPVWAQLARFYAAQKRPDDAEAALARGRAIDPKDPALAAAANVLALSKGQQLPPEAAQDLSAGGNDPGLKALIECAKSYEGTKSTKGLTACLQRLTTERPTYFPGWQALVRVLSEDGKPAEAASAARTAAGLMPADPRPAQLATEALATNDQNEESLAMARDWRQRRLEDPFEPDMVVGQLSIQLGRPAEALAAMTPWRDRVLALGSPVLHGAYATALLGTGKAQEAHAMLWARAQAERPWADLYLRVARTIGTDPALMKEWLDRAAPLLTVDTPGRLALGQARLDLAAATRKPEDFAAVIDTVSSIAEPPDARARAAALMAASHEQRGELAEAERLYRAANQATPDQPFLLNNLASVLLLEGTSLPDAAAFATSAVRLAEERHAPATEVWGYAETLGSALMRLKRYPEAEAAFRKGLGMNPTEPHLILGLAESLAEQGRVEDARAASRQAQAGVERAAVADPTLRQRMQDLQVKLSGGSK